MVFGRSSSQCFHTWGELFVGKKLFAFIGIFHISVMHLRMPKLIAISQFRIQLQSETAYFISYNMIGSSEENVDLFEIW